MKTSIRKVSEDFADPNRSVSSPEVRRPPGLSNTKAVQTIMDELSKLLQDKEKNFEDQR